MKPKGLYVFLEGPDDERFFKAILQPLFEAEGNFVKPVLYSGMIPSQVQALLKTVKVADHLTYLFFCDLDRQGDSSLCITKRKEKISEKYGKHVEMARMVVVREEMEAWYLAGITSANKQKLKLPPYTTTDSITKEAFTSMIPNHFTSSNDFMIEILKEYSLSYAVSEATNTSLRYFFQKFLQ
jgi:hypothetical protein